MRVQENTVLNLSCEASGHPRPTISWNVGGRVSRPISSSRLSQSLPGLCCPDGGWTSSRPLSCGSFGWGNGLAPDVRPVGSDKTRVRHPRYLSSG